LKRCKVNLPPEGTGIAQRAALAGIAGRSGLLPKKWRMLILRRRTLVLDLLQDIPGIKTHVPEGAFLFSSQM